MDRRLIFAVLALAAACGAEAADLDCGDPGAGPDVTVADGDPHGLDTDGDGIGCETP